MNTKRFGSAVVLFAAVTLGVASARGDVVTLKNGDKINGKVGEIAGGKMKFSSPVLGDITIDMTNVRTFDTDAPATVRLKDNSAPVVAKVTAGDAGKLDLDNGKSIDVPDVKQFNPPDQKWTGSVTAFGSLNRGNTNDLTLGAQAAATLRRDDQFYDDRFSLLGQYNFGRTGVGSGATTTTDNWTASGKYDKFFTDKFYGYLSMKAEHDLIANLNYRLTPSVGVGYQWYESDGFNFLTEAGVAYVYEDYTTGGNQDHVALRLAYHVDKKLYDTVSLFHNLEFLPAFDDFGDYNLNADAGVRTQFTKSFFGEFKVEFKRDSTPAEGALKNDLHYMAGVGWNF